MQVFGSRAVAVGALGVDISGTLGSMKDVMGERARAILMTGKVLTSLLLAVLAGCGGVSQFAMEEGPLTDRQKDAAIKALLGPVEFAEYVLITDTIESAEWLRRFWVSHDPTPTTPENEFREEHERRVYHAIYLFGSGFRGGPPWDDRGEVYIRYGQPDERLIRRLGLDDGGALGRVSRSRDFFPNDRLTSLNEREAATEVWTYYRWNETFQFEDQRQTGAFRMVPVTDPYSVRQGVADFYATRLSAVDLQPAIYYHEYGKNLIDYALDVVRFRADSNRWNVDVNLGYPLSELSLGPDSSWVSIRRTLIIRDEEEREVFSEGGRIHRWIGSASSNRLMVEQKIINLPPGKYTLAVTIEDLFSGKSGTYIKTFRLPQYIVPEVQEISDIEMASYVWSIYEPGAPFVKNEYMVVPLPSRVYLPDQPLAFYYEVYNLLLDEEARTAYSVSYEISNSDGDPAENFHQPRSVERSGTSRNISAVGTVDLTGIPAGEYFLTVRVHDHLGNHEKITIARFRKSN